MERRLLLRYSDFYQNNPLLSSWSLMNFSWTKMWECSESLHKDQDIGRTDTRSGTEHHIDHEHLDMGSNIIWDKPAMNRDHSIRGEAGKSLSQSSPQSSIFWEARMKISHEYRLVLWTFRHSWMPFRWQQNLQTRLNPVCVDTFQQRENSLGEMHAIGTLSICSVMNRPNLVLPWIDPEDHHVLFRYSSFPLWQIGRASCRERVWLPV
jgi:hypothetical protein